MKNFTFLFLISIVSLQAQNVQFADSLFKEALIDIGVDRNGDNEIQYSEAEAETYLDFINYSFQDVTGLEAFKNVTEIEFVDVSGIQSLILSEIPKLEILIIRNLRNLIDLEFYNLPNLKDIEIGYDCKTENIDFSVLPNLERLYIVDVDPLKSIDCSNLSSLTFFEQKSNSNLVDVDFTGTKNIEIFRYLDHGDSEDFHVDGSWTELREWSFGQYETAILNLPQLPKLEKLYIGSVDQAEDLDFTIYSSLKELQMTYMDNLKSFNIVGMQNLELLYMNAMWDLREVSIVNLPNLKDVRLEFIARASDVILTELPNLEILKLNNMERVRNISVTNSKATQFEIFSGPDCENLTLENIDPEIVWIDGLDKIKKIDLRAFTKMHFLRLWNCNDLEQVYTKNGIEKIPYEVRQNYNVNYICCDTFDISSVNYGLDLDEVENCVVESTCGIVSIEDAKIEDNMVRVLPTIINELVKILCNEPISQIRLTNISGHRIKSFSNINNYQYEIDMSIYPSGIYFLQVYIQDNLVSKKVIKL